MYACAIEKAFNAEKGPKVAWQSFHFREGYNSSHSSNFIKRNSSTLIPESEKKWKLLNDGKNYERRRKSTNQHVRPITDRQTREFYEEIDLPLGGCFEIAPSERDEQRYEQIQLDPLTWMKRLREPILDRRQSAFESVRRSKS